MASVVFHFFHQFRSEGRVKLFEGSGGYAAGEQRRDFVSIEDVLKVHLEFLDHPDRSGIFNLGSGMATTYNDVAAATINAVRAAEGRAPASLAELVRASRRLADQSQEDIGLCTGAVRAHGRLAQRGSGLQLPLVGEPLDGLQR